MANDINHPGGYITMHGLAGVLAENETYITLDAKSQATIAAAARSGKPVLFGKIDLGGGRYFHCSQPTVFSAFGTGGTVELIADLSSALATVEDGALTEYSHSHEWSAVVYSDGSAFLGVYEV